MYKMYALSSVAADDRLRSEFIWATNEGSSMCVHTHEGTSRRGNELERELHYSEGIRGHLSRMFARSSSSTMTTMCRKFSISV